MSGQRAARLRAELSAEDSAVLELLAMTRLASSTQIRRLVIEPDLTPARASNGIAARANRRLLTRLVKTTLIRRLPRRIGGPGGGSAAPIYVLTALGQRVIDGDRPLLREPSWQLMAHSLAITEVVVQGRILERLGIISLRDVQVEPRAWRSWPGPMGSPEWLKPDGFLELEQDGYLEAWFIEADLGTERSRVIRTKTARYQRYRQTGREQDRLGLFPRVLWAVPDQRRADQLAGVIAELPPQQQGVHATVSIANVAALVSGQAEPLARPRPPP